MAKQTEDIGARTLRFLAAHGLEPTPEHYAFAYRYVSGRDREFSDAVDHYIEGGVRLREEALRALMPEESWPNAGAALGLLAGQLMDLVRDATSVTGDLNRDLVLTAAALVSSDPPRLKEAVGFMIERTAQAETALSLSLRQAQVLRDRLTGARDDVGRDPLTGLPGHEAMAERLDAGLVSGEHCSVALVGIDQLAGLAGEHGEGMSDRLLKAVALTLRDACSPHQVGRWGETSFAVFLDGVGVEAGAAVLEAARADMAAKRLKLRENDEPLGQVTLSIGVAGCRGRKRQKIVSAAQRLLSRASAGGGDRVIAEAPLIDVASD